MWLTKRVAAGVTNRGGVAKLERERMETHWEHRDS